MLFQNKFFEGRSKYQEAKKFRILKHFGRIGLLTILYTPRLIVQEKYYKPLENEYAQFFVQSLMPNFFTAFLVFALTDHLCLKLGLYDRAQLNQIENSDDESFLEKQRISTRASLQFSEDD